MSTKVLARAGVEGRGIDILIPGLDAVISGYLVGMDDFHLQIAEISAGEVTIGLVHKTAGVISLNPYRFLKDEAEPVRSEIKEIGQPFWDFCAANYLGKNGKEESQ